ncbi:MAG: hypothetical protein NC253_02350 [Ruminococcus sp.]|nr:hypothetical protein [Ruminococcus sp.]MCM1382511.1 hypothetical protein [Muribaculaceae bacterium]MCM1480243.1 hypothetical protein [Muribaculaceae bacterium]
MRTLKHPSYNEINRLKQIWLEGFPDDGEGYCDFYFEKYFRPERCFAVYNEFEIESAVHWFEAYRKGSDGNKYKFIFPYAGATLKKYRGHKNLQFMIEGCDNFSKKNGYAGMVFAAADELVYLYDKWGYSRISRLNTYTFDVSRRSEILNWKICPFEKFKIMRNNFLGKIGNCFYWCGDAEKYMYDDVFTKGKILFCEYNNTEYFAVCTMEKNCLIIRETDFPLDNSELLTESVCGHFNYFGRVSIYTHKKNLQPAGEYVFEDIYYGHYGLNFNFPGSERLGSAYINLIAD